MTQFNGGFINDDLPVSTLMEIATSTSEKKDVCWAAYIALAKKNTKLSVDFILNGLGNSDWIIRRICVESMQYLTFDTKFVKLLLKMFNDSNEYVIRAACSTCAEFSIKESRPFIQKLINNGDEPTKIVALESLSKLWENTDFELLLNIFKSSLNENIKKTIGFVLSEHVTSLNWLELYQLFKNDKLARHRAWAIELIGKFDSNFEKAKEFLNDSDGHVRIQAKKLIEEKSLVG